MQKPNCLFSSKQLPKYVNINVFGQENTNESFFLIAALSPRVDIIIYYFFLNYSLILFHRPILLHIVVL